MSNVSLVSNEYMAKLKKIVLDFFEGKKVKVYLFGSRARGDGRKTSDVDIGILPENKINDIKINFLREEIENSNIPYNVEIVNLNEVSEDFKEEILKDALIWKD